MQVDTRNQVHLQYPDGMSQTNLYLKLSSPIPSSSPEKSLSFATGKNTLFFSTVVTQFDHLHAIET